MDILLFIVVSLVSFLGLGVGTVLAFVAKEEVFQGKRYFIWMERSLLLIPLVYLLVLFAFYDIRPGVIGIVVFGIVVFLVKNTKLDVMGYAFFAIILALYRTSPLDVMIPSFAFLYGYPVASRLSIEHYGKKIPAWKDLPGRLRVVLFRYAWFPLLSVLFFLFFGTSL